MSHVYRAEQRFGRPPEALFPFFADAFNLERITPPFLRFRAVTPPPIRMGVGTLIDYRLRVHGVPLRWRTEITAWEPPRRFVDEQIRGPYRRWIHEHRFEPLVGGGTRMIDTVHYAAPGGRLVERLVVDRDVASIFGYRRRVLEELFAADQPPEVDASRSRREAPNRPSA
jgi:ligand-binding SRPBCC domain-containing protein